MEKYGYFTSGPFYVHTDLLQKNQRVQTLKFLLNMPECISTSMFFCSNMNLIENTNVLFSCLCD